MVSTTTAATLPTLPALSPAAAAKLSKEKKKKFIILKGPCSREEKRSGRREENTQTVDHKLSLTTPSVGGREGGGCGVASIR